jgi:hypothetical protein
MEKPCPICQLPFEEKKLPEHLESAHKGSISPDIQEMRAELEEHPAFKCMVCHVALPSPEAVRDHHHSAHGL